METNKYAKRAVEEPENLKKHLENLLRYHFERLKKEGVGVENAQY